MNKTQQVKISVTKKIFKTQNRRKTIKTTKVKISITKKISKKTQQKKLQKDS